MKRFPIFVMSIIFLRNIFFALFLLCSLPTFSQEAIAVIGNAKGSPTELKMMQLQSVLKGEKLRWTDGTKVVIALMKTNTSIGNVTSRKLFNMSGDQVNKFWLGLVFQGKADAPTFFNSTNDLESFVSQTPGAIGITSASSNFNQKTILVDGKKTL